jgi:nitrogen PTS system EIIA component
MQLISLLDPKLIYFEERQLSKKENYQNLVDKICKFYRLPQCGGELLELILKRDAEVSTVYPNGLAIPHVRIDNFNDTVIAVCIPRKPILDDGKEIRIIVCIITDKTVAKLYLNLVAAIIRVSKVDTFLTSLVQQKDGLAVYNLLKQENLTIKDDLIVKDIMTTNPVIVKETSTIRELADLFSQYNIKNLPVINEQGHFVGEVNILHYLRSAYRII